METKGHSPKRWVDVAARNRAFVSLWHGPWGKLNFGNTKLSARFDESQLKRPREKKYVGPTQVECVRQEVE